MKIHGGDNWNKVSWMKIHDGESEMPIDVWSMVVTTDQSPRMKILGGESQKHKDENPWWWYNLKSPMMKIHGGDNPEMPKDENPW